MTSAAALAGALLALVGAAAAQQPAPTAPPAAPPVVAPGGAGGAPATPQPLPGEPRCGFCKTTGRVPFDADPEFVLEQDHGDTWTTQFCSVALDSPNMGLPWQPCPRCKTPSLHAIAQKEWDDHRAAGDDWLKERRKVDKLAAVDEPLVQVQTTHFLIIWNIPRISTADKKNYDAHAAAHLYARRMEAFYARFQTMFGITDADNMKNVHTIMVFEKPEQQAAAAPAYTGLDGFPTVKRSGGSNHESTVVTWWDKSEFPKEVDMWRHQIHNIVHQLTAVYYNFKWFKPGEIGLSPPWLNDKYGWIDEGLAHWFEIDFDKVARTYCIREANVDSRWGGSDWRKNIFKAVSDGDIPPFAEIILKASPALSAKENQFCWSWVDYLLKLDPLAMGKAIKLCKQKVQTRDILKECWNIQLIDFESQWKEWVLETYAPTRKS